jgi:hypothetical protein
MARDMVFNANLKKYFSYIVAVSFIGGGSHSDSLRRKPPTCRKSLKKIISHNIVWSTLRHERASNSIFVTTVIT